MLCADDTSIIIYDPEKELFQNLISNVFDSFNILFKVNTLTSNMDETNVMKCCTNKIYIHFNINLRNMLCC